MDLSLFWIFYCKSRMNSLLFRYMISKINWFNCNYSVFKIKDTFGLNEITLFYHVYLFSYKFFK